MAARRADRNGEMSLFQIRSAARWREPGGANRPPTGLDGWEATYAHVRLDGHQIMLGRFGTPETRQGYTRVMAEWEADGCRLPADLTARHWAVEKISLGEFHQLYRNILADEFGIQQLKATHHKMIGAGLARRMSPTAESLHAGNSTA